MSTLTRLTTSRRFRSFVGAALILFGLWDSFVAGLVPALLEHWRFYLHILSECREYACFAYAGMMLFGVPVVLGFYFTVGSMLILSSLTDGTVRS